MKFLTYWSESKKMLQLTELKLLFIDSMKTFGKSLVLITKYFWWLIVLVAGQAYCAHLLESPTKITWADTFNQLANMFNKIASLPFAASIIAAALLFCLIVLFIVAFFVYMSPLMMLIFTSYLTTRPTAETKNFTYYRKHLKMFWGCLIIFMSVVTIFIIIRQITSLDINLLTIMLTPFLLPADPCLFSFFDSDRKIIVSIKRGFSLTFYFLPLYLVLCIPVSMYYLLRFFIQQFAMRYQLTTSPVIQVFDIILALIVILASASISATVYAKIKNRYPEFLNV